MTDIKLIVAAHKPYRMPEDKMYLPVQAGAHGKEPIGFSRDDTGDNISEKNPYYCELTCIYWAWKNLDAEYTGLCHYRRYFSEKKAKDPFSGILSEKKAKELLEKAPVVLPKKRRYYIENLYSHYVHTLDPVPLEITGEVIKEKYPSYLHGFEQLKKRRSAHMFNMFIMRRDIFADYCGFLFGVLSELEKRVPEKHYEDKFQARFFGRVSELLLDVFIEENGIKYTECPFVNIEGEKWGKKIKGFLLSKFFGKKYSKSI